MRDHAEIIRAGGGPAAFSEAIGLLGRPYTVRSWQIRNSIPGWAWLRIAVANIASLEELARAAEERGWPRGAIKRPAVKPRKAA